MTKHKVHLLNAFEALNHILWPFSQQIVIHLSLTENIRQCKQIIKNARIHKTFCTGKLILKRSYSAVQDMNE